MRRILLVLILLVISSCYVQAKPFNDTEWGLLQLERIAMKTQTVESDMRLCIDRDDFKGDRKEASKDAFTRLEAVRKELKKLKNLVEKEKLQKTKI